MNENNTLEHLVSKLLILQSRLECETTALQSLIKIAKNYAENESSGLEHILDVLETKVNTIKSAVQTLE